MKKYLNPKQLKEMYGKPLSIKIPIKEVPREASKEVPREASKEVPREASKDKSDIHSESPPMLKEVIIEHKGKYEVIPNVNLGIEYINIRTYDISEINILEKIGGGAYGDVMIGNFKDRPDLPIVVKRLKNYNEKNFQDVFRELILTQYLNMNTKYAIRIYGTLLIHDGIEDKLYVILEKFGDSIHKNMRKGIKYSKEQYKLLFSNILKAYSSLHSCGVFHSDIKPDNILMDEHFNVKIIDFGLSTYLGISPLLNNVENYISTYDFSPKEDVKKRRKSYQSDSFAIGQMFFNILIRKYEFLEYKKYIDHRTKNTIEVLSNTSLCTDSVLKDYIISRTAENFYEVLLSLINSDIMKRLTAKEALELPYFTNEMHGGIYTLNRNNVEYNKYEFENGKYELAYIENIVSKVGNMKIKFSPIDIFKKSQLQELNEIMEEFYNNPSSNYILSENNIFNTICYIRNATFINNLKEMSQYLYPVNYAFASIDAYSTINIYKYVEIAGKNLINIYSYNVSKLYEDFLRISDLMITNPKMPYYPIWTIIEYFSLIYKYNHDIHIDNVLIFNNIVNLIIAIDNDLELTLWQICLYVIHKNYKHIFNINDEERLKLAFLAEFEEKLENDNIQ